MPTISDPRENLNSAGYDVVIELDQSLDQFCLEYYSRLSDFFGFDMDYAIGTKRLIWLLQETADTNYVGTMRVAMGKIGDTHVTAYLDRSRLVFQFDSEFVATQHLTDKQERAYRKRLVSMKGTHYSVAKRFAEHLRS